MSIFTKIFVVLVMVLSVLLVAMVVPFVVNSNTYKADYQAERAQRLVAQSSAAELEAAVTAAMSDRNEQMNQLNDRIVQLQNELNNRDSIVQDQRAELIALRSASGDIRAELSRLSSGFDQAMQINASLQEEVRDRRDRMITLNTRAVEISDELRASATEVDTLERQVRLLQEQNADISQQNEEIIAQLQASGVNLADASGSQPFEAEVPIRGRITRVQDIGEETFVALNVGRNDNVSEGMRFMVHRGNEFLGNVVVNRVDENSSAGRVTLRRGEISTDAQVQSGGS